MYCPEHRERMLKRLGSNEVKKPDLPESKSQMSLSERELRFLRFHKILSNSAFVYFALRVDAANQASKEVDIRSFCDRWGVTQYDLTSAVSTLGKKGFVSLNGGNLVVEAHSESDIIHRLSDQVKHA